ncbi:enolase [Encephalitozoon hellem ATCC 50504]|eukprot:XP_003888245.1 enolase [Encephalitozoon hellem ATCC 50504]
MKVKDVLLGIKPRMVLTSRGYPTVEVDLVTSNGVYRSSCPSGASRGSKEAVVITDGGSLYNGRGVRTVINNINSISGDLLELECSVDDQSSIDNCLLQLDGTSNKSKIGGNGIIALSTAFCKMGAGCSNRRVDTLVSGMGNFKRNIPIPHFNVLNGGVHSGNGMSVQEIMVVYQHDSLEKNIESGCVLYEALRKTISEKYGSLYTSVGDEGGFAPPIKKLEDGLDLVLEASKRCHRTDMKIAIDFAANEFARDDGRYELDGGVYTTRNLGEKYIEMLRKYPQVYSIEDPFSERDCDGWCWINAEVGDKVNIVGDDLTATNPHLVEDAGARRMCNTLLVKPNQIGTVSETIEAIKIARKYGMKIMVSHRSGETEDNFISDLSVGVGAEYMKSGAPCRGERVSKYNQLLRLSEY